jgi:sec-independent protein translocase protein TatB
VELLSPLNFLVLGVLALIMFGPDRLPKMASQAGRALRDLRRIAESAKADLQEGLGPEFSDFDITDLDPKNFVRKHLWDEFDGTSNGGSTTLPDGSRVSGIGAVRGSDGASLLAPGESPPYDAEAT